jgi:hypothetical protein
MFEATVIDFARLENRVMPEGPDRPDDPDKPDGPDKVENPDPLDFRRESKIWDLYLEDAEHAAKDKVQLMKSGLLDSVLLFVRGQYILGVNMVVIWLTIWAGRFIRWGGFFFRH